MAAGLVSLLVSTGTLPPTCTAAQLLSLLALLLPVKRKNKHGQQDWYRSVCERGARHVAAAAAQPFFVLLFLGAAPQVSVICTFVRVKQATASKVSTGERTSSLEFAAVTPLCSSNLSSNLI